MTGPDQIALMQTSNLTVGYGNLKLFDNLHLVVKPGEMVCLMGPNGSGKSTLLRCLAGLQTPLNGSVTGIHPKNIAVVLTDKITASFMTVRELISFGRYPHLDWNIRFTEADRHAIETAVHSTQVAHLLDHKIYELSDGQLQMCMIARALTQDTPVLILDEPTSHLDLNNRLEIMNMLRTLAHQNGKAIVMATHELDLALQCADRVWLAKDQQIRTGIPEDLVLDGSFDDVFQFKGYDLKSGKVKHAAFRNREVALQGDDAVYLWTKNALERNGYAVVDKGELTVKITDAKWQIGTTRFENLEAVIAFIDEWNF